MTLRGAPAAPGCRSSGSREHLGGFLLGLAEGALLALLPHHLRHLPLQALHPPGPRLHRRRRDDAVAQRDSRLLDHLPWLSHTSEQCTCLSGEAQNHTPRTSCINRRTSAKAIVHGDERLRCWLAMGSRASTSKHTPAALACEHTKHRDETARWSYTRTKHNAVFCTNLRITEGLYCWVAPWCIRAGS